MTDHDEIVKEAVRAIRRREERLHDNIVNRGDFEITHRKIEVNSTHEYGVLVYNYLTEITATYQEDGGNPVGFTVTVPDSWDRISLAVESVRIQMENAVSAMISSRKPQNQVWYVLDEIFSNESRARFSGSIDADYSVLSEPFDITVMVVADFGDAEYAFEFETSVMMDEADESWRADIERHVRQRIAQIHDHRAVTRRYTYE